MIARDLLVGPLNRRGFGDLGDVLLVQLGDGKRHGQFDGEAGLVRHSDGQHVQHDIQPALAAVTAHEADLAVVCAFLGLGRHVKFGVDRLRSLSSRGVVERQLVPERDENIAQPFRVLRGGAGPRIPGLEQLQVLARNNILGALEILNPELQRREFVLLAGEREDEAEGLVLGRAQPKGPGVAIPKA